MALELLFAVKYLVSLCASGSSHMLIFHVFFQIHLGLEALMTLGASVEVPSPWPPPPLLQTLKPPPSPPRPGP